MVSVALCSRTRYDDVYLRRAWMTKSCPIITPVVFVEWRIQEAKPGCGVRDLRNKDDQIDIVAAVVPQESAARHHGHSFGYGVANSVHVIRDHCAHLVAR
jgi:hypothetical protein